MSSRLFLKFMHPISVSKYGVTAYILDFTQTEFALVKILTNDTSKDAQKLNACPEIAPGHCSDFS